MRVLVTGAGGFVGRHVLHELTAHGHEAFGIDLDNTGNSLAPGHSFTGCITDAGFLSKVVTDITPNACIHLAGVAFAGGWNPELVLKTNIQGTTTVLETFRLSHPSARILSVSSAHVYGMKARSAPIREDDPPNPDTIYAIAKTAADRIALLYARQFGLNVMVARPHNHIGPGQSPQFAIPSFARQVKAISQGASPVIKTGNLDNHRDFTDVRDIARAYRLLLEKGRSGQAYNVSSGREVRLGDILDRLCQLGRIHPDIVRDETLYRPRDQNPVLDTSRIRNDTGWAPTIPLDQTLSDILDTL